jgi:hypothetical protein
MFLTTPPRQTERSFMRAVVEYAELRGWRCYHTHTSKHSPAGFPDLVLVRARHPQPRVVYIECKADRGRVTVDQRAWIADLRACEQEAYVFRPRHMDAIIKLLA